MYSLALMTFDANIDISLLPTCLDKCNAGGLIAPIADGSRVFIPIIFKDIFTDYSLSTLDELPEKILWKMHILALWKYRSLDMTGYSKENFDQFAIYFELMVHYFSLYFLKFRLNLLFMIL